MTMKRIYYTITLDCSSLARDNEDPQAAAEQVARWIAEDFGEVDKVEHVKVLSVEDAKKG